MSQDTQYFSASEGESDEYFSPKSSSSYIKPIKKYPPGFEPSNVPIGYGRKKYNQVSYEFNNDYDKDKEIIAMVNELLKDSGNNKRSRIRKSKISRRRKSVRSRRRKSKSKISRMRKSVRSRRRKSKRTRNKRSRRSKSKKAKILRSKNKRSRRSKSKKYKVNEDDIKFIKKQSVIGLKSYIKSKGLKGYTKFNKEQLINFILKKIDIDTGKLL